MQNEYDKRKKERPGNFLRAENQLEESLIYPNLQMAQRFEDSQHKSIYETQEERKITALEEDFRSVTEARDVAKPQKYLVAKKDQEQDPITDEQSFEKPKETNSTPVNHLNQSQGSSKFPKPPHSKKDLDILEREKQLEQVSREIQEPPLDNQSKKAALTLEQRLDQLSLLLLKDNLDDYLNILRDDEELQNSDGFQAALKPFKVSIQKLKWDQLSVGIFKTFLKGEVNQHYAMKIFLMHQQASVMNPFLMNQAYQAIKNLQVREEDQDIHQEFLVDFTRLTVDQVNQKVGDIIDESEDYGTAVAEIMKTLKTSAPEIQAPSIIHQPVQDQQLKEFEVDFGNYKSFRMAKEALFKKDLVKSSQLIRALIAEIVDQHPLEQRFIEMYSSIIKALPDFQYILSDEQVFAEFAPAQLQTTVRELFKQLKKHASSGPSKNAHFEELKENIMKSRHQDGDPSQRISDCIRELFNEDARFNEMLCRYLIETSAYVEVVRAALNQIKTSKTLRQEHLEKASDQITSKERDSQNIADFMAVNIDVNFLEQQKNMGDWFGKSQTLDGVTTTIVLYDLIKKKCNFENFLKILSQNRAGSSEQMLFTQQFFLSYLLNNSDTYLRTMILMTCSNFMPLPLVSYQPKKQKIIPMQLNHHESKSGCEKMMAPEEQIQDMAGAQETKQQFTPHVYEELFYCFEKCMAVLAFKVSANPNKSPQGCSTLTNYVFNRSFQTHSNSLVNYGSIDIQFDYNFEHPMFVPVADAHGLVEEGILECVYPLFNIFIIHSLYGEEHQKVAEEQINKIHQAIKNPLIFQIIHDESSKEQYLSTSIVQNVVQLNISRYNDLLEMDKQKLRTLILQHFLQYIEDSNGYDVNIDARLKSLQEFSEFADRFRSWKNQKEGIEHDMHEEAQGESQEQVQRKEGLTIIRDLMKLIDDNKEHLRSVKVLKMNVLFEEACCLEKQLLRDASLKRETSEEYRIRVAELYNEMRDSLPSPLTLELTKIIDLQNYLGLTSIISKFFKSLLNLHLKPLLKEREQLNTNVQNAIFEKNIKDEMIDRIREITKTLEQRYCSIEFFYREQYISELSELKGSEKPPSQSFTDYLSLCNLQISQGQPFEIIDGNNLQFIKEVYQKIQDGGRQDEEILVLSVIGPQSSGKSLLLNTLFGAQFLSSAGRCTRGIYGCLIDIKSDIKQTNFKKMLILDSEGIQSTEATDEAFDKRVVFYMLCVSHVVLICNKGEMNKNMEDTIKLATDCMLQVRQKIDQKPQVNVIMNCVKIDENSLYQTVQSLSTCLLEMGGHESQSKRQIFTINESNVFLLPNAFAQSGNEGFVAYKPSYQFAEKVDQLRNKIIDYIQSNEEKAFFTQESWFQFAQGFWEFTDGYSGLTDYKTLEERKEDIALREFTKNLIAVNFEDPQMDAKHEKMIHDKVGQVLNQHQGFDQVNVNAIRKKIDDAMHPKQQEVEQKIYIEFRKFADEKKIRPEIKKRRVEQLETQMKLHFFNWQQIINKLVGQYNEQKYSIISYKSLQRAIDLYIKASHAQYNDQEAELLFQTEWKKIVDRTDSQLKTIDQIYREQFTDIGQNLYRQNFRQLIGIEDDHECLKDFNKFEDRLILKRLQKQEKFFYFDAKTEKPSSEQFKQQIEREKYFINHKNLEFFDENKNQRYYNWKKIIEERFKFEALSEQFKESHSQQVQLVNVSTVSPYNYLLPQKMKKLITQKDIDAVIMQIQDEAKHFNIDVTNELKTQLYKLEKKSYDGSATDANICVEQIKQRLQAFFKFNLQDNNAPAPNQKWIFFSYYANDNYAKKRSIRTFSAHNYIEKLDPQDERSMQQGFAALDQKQIYFTIKRQVEQDDKNFAEYLKFLVEPIQNQISSRLELVDKAAKKFFSLVDHEKVLKIIQKNVLEKIYKNKDQIKHKTVENLVQDLIQSQDNSITQEFCTMDFMVVQRIAISIEEIVQNINDDMDPYWFTVSEFGRDCLHQIAQTYIVRIMQEVIRLTEYAPKFSLAKTMNEQRKKFVYTLTSNEILMDRQLATMTGKHLAQRIIKGLKIEHFEAFQKQIKANQNKFKLKTILSNIEIQTVQIAEGQVPDLFEIEYRPQAGDSWLERWQKLKLSQGDQDQEHQEEEKKQEFMQQMSTFKKVDANLEFTPEEILVSYVMPREFLAKKFKDQWSQVANEEIKKTKQAYVNRINQIKLNFKLYLDTFLKQVENKKIQLAANVFIPEFQDKPLSEEYTTKIFFTNCKKAMAIYIGLVVNQEWIDNTAIQVDENTKMLHPENMSLVKHDDIGIELFQPYDRMLQEYIQNEQISNIQSFIKNLLTALETHLNPEQPPENSLQDNELIGNLYQDMLTKTLGCDQMCPLCRRRCDQIHDFENLEDQIHRCETGHQIQGFGGNFDKYDNNAITFGCDEMHDKDMVNWKGSNIKWEKFKSKIYSEHRWNLEDIDQEAKKLIKEKNVKIWNKIGPFICEYYKYQHGIDIKFEKAEMKKKQIEKVHYILMLDNSGSMDSRDRNGKSCWHNLKSAVSSFIAKFDSSLQYHSKVSIITYNNTARLQIESKTPTPAILNNLPNPSGGTEFGPPLDMAEKLIDKYQDEFDSFVLVMMSDGCSDYPQQSIQKICESPAKDKVKFKAIAYGHNDGSMFFRIMYYIGFFTDGRVTLQKMADELGGTMQTVIEPGKLPNAFIEMIPNLYSNK